MNMNFRMTMTKQIGPRYYVMLALRLAIPMNGMVHEVPLFVKDDRGVDVPMIIGTGMLSGLN